MGMTKAAIAFCAITLAAPSLAAPLGRPASLSSFASSTLTKVNDDWVWAWEHTRTPSHFRWSSRRKWYSFSKPCCCGYVLRSRCYQLSACGSRWRNRGARGC